VGGVAIFAGGDAFKPGASHAESDRKPTVLCLHGLSVNARGHLPADELLEGIAEPWSRSGSGHWFKQFFYGFDLRFDFLGDLL